MSDVCLILEGAYPFVTGGVSAWVHRIITRLPHLRFHVVHLSPHHDAYPEGPRYTLPENVVGFHEVPLGGHEILPEGLTCSRRDRRAEAQGFAHLVSSLAEGTPASFRQAVRGLRRARGAPLDLERLLVGRAGWQALERTYGTEAARESLLRFAWMWRASYEPLLHVVRAHLPRTAIVHSACTGYAGLLAVVHKELYGSRLLLTEHGIYTRERRIDIWRSTWLPDAHPDDMAPMQASAYFKWFWVRQFASMSRLAYAAADRVLTLHAGNIGAQVRDGADPERIEIIPNGIDRTRFKAHEGGAPVRRPEEGPVVGFVGRVCPIKDLATLLRAARLVVDRLPQVRFRIVGPAEEDPEYLADLQALQAELGLQTHVAFEGRQNSAEVYPDLDLCVLSSISESQPLVLLEAGAVGVPAVTTDVGACRELLEGRAPEDRALGAGGVVVPMASPGRMADALLSLLTDPERRRAMGQAMKARVTRFYDEDMMIRAYDDLYARCLTPAAEAWPSMAVGVSG